MVDSSRVDFVFLQQRWIVEAGVFPRFTLAGQTLGSIILGRYAISESSRVAIQVGPEWVLLLLLLLLLFFFVEVLMSS